MSLPETEYCFVFQNDKLILRKQDNGGFFPHPSDLSLLRPHFLRHHPIGMIKQTTYQAAEIHQDVHLPDTLVALSLRKAFDLLGEEWFGAAIKAYSVINWDRNHQFCSRCGSKTNHVSTSFERLCSSCGMVFYPRISPSVIVLIRKGDHLLMARSPHFPPGAYGLIAGFVEVGETLEQTIHREIMEEVQIKVKNIQYYGSQP